MENRVIDGRYSLLGELGSGGEARVYHARDETTGNEVALRIGLAPANRAEPVVPPASHDGWVQFLGSGMDAKLGAYQILELLEGLTIRQLAPDIPFDAEDWRTFVHQSLDSVEALHLAGWVHGDINADNFLATNVRWKLLELPFLRLAPPKGRSTIFGSIYTLSPEQINGAKADVASDLYALGCLYYYTASGVYPHMGATEAEIAISRLRFDADPLREKAPDLPGAWTDWVMKLVARQPADRFPSIAAARQLLGVA